MKTIKEQKEKAVNNKNKRVLRSLTGPTWTLTPNDILDAVAWAQRTHARIKWSLEQLDKKRSK